MLSGVILAGGSNRSVNGPVKAFLPVSGEAIIHRQIREMKQLCSEVIVVTDEPKKFLPELDRSIRIITDYVQGKGPLGGMHAAFKLSKYDNLWIVGCNMPFISKDAARLMWERRKLLSYDAVIPVIHGSTLPLHGVYHQSCVEVMDRIFRSANVKVTELLGKIAWGAVTDAFFQEQNVQVDFGFTVDTSEQYLQAQKKAASLSRMPREA